MLRYRPAPGASFGGGRGIFYLEAPPKPPRLLRPASSPLPTRAAALWPRPRLSELLSESRPPAPGRPAADPQAAAQLSPCVPQLRAGETGVAAARRAEPSPPPRGTPCGSGPPAALRVPSSLEGTARAWAAMETRAHTGWVGLPLPPPRPHFETQEKSQRRPVAQRDPGPPPHCLALAAQPGLPGGARFSAFNETFEALTRGRACSAANGMAAPGPARAEPAPERPGKGEPRTGAEGEPPPAAPAPGRDPAWPGRWAARPGSASAGTPAPLAPAAPRLCAVLSFRRCTLASSPPGRALSLPKPRNRLRSAGNAQARQERSQGLEQCCATLTSAGSTGPHWH